MACWVLCADKEDRGAAVGLLWLGVVSMGRLLMMILTGVALMEVLVVRVGVFEVLVRVVPRVGVGLIVLLIEV